MATRPVRPEQISLRWPHKFRSPPKVSRPQTGDLYIEYGHVGPLPRCTCPGTAMQSDTGWIMLRQQSEFNSTVIESLRRVKHQDQQSPLRSLIFDSQCIGSLSETPVSPLTASEPSHYERKNTPAAWTFHHEIVHRIATFSRNGIWCKPPDQRGKQSG